MENCDCHMAPFYLEDPRLSVGTKEYLKVLNALDSPIETLPVPDTRNLLFTLQTIIETDLTGIEESVKIIVQDNFEIKLNIIRPVGADEVLPVFIFIHGGGWVMGDYATHKRFVRDLVVESGIACVFPNYSRSPESRFPQAVNEIYATLKWVSKNGEDIRVDGKNIALMGTSNGGNMAIATSLMAKDNNGPQIKHQILVCPFTDSSTAYDSRDKFGNERFLTAPLLEWMFNQYTKDPVAKKDIHISPVISSIEQLKGLPSTFIAVAENDIVRDEGELLGRKLDEAGVAVTTIRFNGVIHDWAVLNGFTRLSPVHSLVMFISSILRKMY